MKDSWIRASTGILPELEPITVGWKSSEAVLVLTRFKVPEIGILQTYDGKTTWIVRDYLYPLDYVIEWQPIVLHE
jgi:hypothetical protein